MTSQHTFDAASIRARRLAEAAMIRNQESANATTDHAKPKKLSSRASVGSERSRGNLMAVGSTDFADRNGHPQCLPHPLQVTHLGPCFTRGGAEQQIIDLGKFLNPKRVQIQKCLVTQESLIDAHVVSDSPASVEVVDADAVRRAAQSADVLMFWGMKLDAWLSGCRPKLCVYLAHGDSHWTRDLLIGSANVVDHVIAVSHRVEQTVCNGFPTSVILNGIDAARLATTRPRSAVRESLGFQPEDFVLGYLGRYSPEKCPDQLIEVVARLPPRFKALFVGWGPMREKLMQRANALIPGRFAFTTADAHLGDYYQTMDAFCLLSIQEGFSLALLEAMMSRCPVIATAVGSVPEVVEHRVSGIVVDGSVEAVCKAAQLLARYPQWASAIAAEGCNFAQHHGHALRMARQYEDLLQRLWIEKHGDGGGMPEVTLTTS